MKINGYNWKMALNGLKISIAIAYAPCIIRVNGDVNMEYNLNRESGVPLYRQVKNLILNKVKSGELSSGYKMPTERELSDQLTVSRNTISSAYKELEKEGILISKQGKGTFVAEESTLMASGEFRERIIRFIDLGLDEAIEAGVEPKNYIKMVEQRVEERVDSKRLSKAVYVECNVEQARYFSNQLRLGTNLECEPLTIPDLIEMDNETKLKLYNADVIVSTFNHVPEVMEYTKAFGKEVLGVAINPDLSTIVKLARYPIETRIAFVSISSEFSEKVKLAINEAGLSDLDISYTTTQDKEELKKVVEGKDIVLVSPGRKRDVVELVPDERVQSFIYNLDEGSLKALKTKLLELNIL